MLLFYYFKNNLFLFIYFVYFIYLFTLFTRERGRGGQREEEKHECLRETLISCLLHALNGEPGLQPRNIP